MHPSTLCKRPRRPLWPAPLLVAALAIAACGGGERTVVELAELVDHQAKQVSTDVISPEDALQLERVGFGWVYDGDFEPGGHLEPRARWARLSFYSQSADTNGLQVEGTLTVDPDDDRFVLVARVNGKPAGKRVLAGGRAEYRFSFPPGAVREGENELELRLKPDAARSRPGFHSLFRVHRVRFSNAADRAPRLDRPSRLTVRDREGEGRALLMPAPARFDAVLPLPPRARFATTLQAAFPAGAGGALEVSIRLLDDEGVEHALWNRRLTERTEEAIDLDLSAWEGRLARLTLAAAGDVSAELRWREPRVLGRPEPESERLIAPAGLEAPPASGRLGRSDVLVILLDAARADAFSSYGGEHPTPAVDRLAAAGTRFTEARSPSSWTGQSVPAIFTGLHPDSIGIEHWGSRLPAAAPTLAELFAAAGYRTVLWSQHPFYTSHTELQRGFEATFFSDHLERDLLPSADDLLADERPVFAFVHLMPPHTPYEPPPPFRGAYTREPTPPIDVSAKALNAFPDRRDPSELDAADREYIWQRYLENVAYADALVGRVTALFEGAGRFDDAFVAVVSDHGEAFLEHDRFLHGLHVYREYVHVPFVVKWPAGVDGHRQVVERGVSLVDLVPTLVDGLGLGPGLGFQGRSLLPAVFDAEPPGERPVYAYTRGNSDGSRPARPKLALEGGGFRFILEREPPTRRLYLEEGDRGEQTDLAETLPLRALLLEQAVLLQQELNHRLRDGLGSAPPARELDPETVERLRALGYLN